jgi:hypothetical protein
MRLAARWGHTSRVFRSQSCILMVAGLMAASGAWPSGSRPMVGEPHTLGTTLPSETQAGQRGQPPPAATGTGFLAGQVVDQASGRGVSGASVLLLSATRGGPASRIGRGNASPWAVVADSQGRFFFAELPASSYTIQVTKAGYGPAATISPSRVVDIADGERVTDLQIRLLKLASLSGTIRDEVGDPVVGTEVWAFRRTLVNGRRTLVRTVGFPSDDHGLYRIADLVPGAYVICACSRDPIPFDGVLLATLAADPLQLMGVAARALKVGADVASLDGTLRTFAPTFYPDSSTMARAARVTLASGEERTAVDVDVTSVRATRVSGTIVGALGPVQASSIQLVTAGESEEGAAISTLMPVLVQPDGRFDFVGVPPGQYVVKVVHRPSDGRGGGAPSGAALAFLGDRAAGMASAEGSPLPNEPPLWAADPVSVGEEGVAGLSIALRRATSITGRLQFVGAAPQPSADVLGRMVIIPNPTTPDPSGLGGRTVGRVSGDGTFRMPGVLPGRYGLTSTAVPGWPTLKAIVIAGVDVTDVPIEVEATDLSDVVLTFVDTPMAALTGTMAGGQNSSAADTTVLVFPTDRRYWSDPAAGRRRFRSSPVSRTGSFTIAALPAGEYFVIAVPDEAANEWQEVGQLESLSTTAQRVALLDGDRKTLEIRR